MSRVSLQADERSNYKQVCATVLGKGEHTKCKNVKSITLQKCVYFFGSICTTLLFCFFVFLPHSLRFIYSLNQKLEEAPQEAQCSRPVCPPLIAFHVFFLMLILYCCRGGLLFFNSSSGYLVSQAFLQLFAQLFMSFTPSVCFFWTQKTMLRMRGCTKSDLCESWHSIWATDDQKKEFYEFGTEWIIVCSIFVFSL